MSDQGKSEGWGAAIAVLFFRNWITMFGATMTTVSAFLIAAFVAMGLWGGLDSPYIGLIAFMVLPGFFVAGLLLIPVGVLWERRRLRMGKEPSAMSGVITLDFRQAKTRRAFGLIVFLTLTNLFIISAVSYRGLVYSESVEFCGTVCHTVMEPEFAAYSHSPHSEVKCVECHIGPGAPWFVRSKLSGVRQVFAVLLGTYSTPIPTPVHNLRPSRDTCEECHRPDHFTGDRVQVRTKFAEDETNTELTSVLVMHIGGGHGEGKGVHSWHISEEKETLYLSPEDNREEISLVRVKDADGSVKNYTTSDFEGDAEAIPDSELRRMDCIDCHNRPTHIYQTPQSGMNEALNRGWIDTELPYIKMLGVEALTQAAEVEDPTTHIRSHILSYYQENNPDLVTNEDPRVETAINQVQAIFNRNVFPKMNVTWNTYPNFIGHPQGGDEGASNGCFRCHDESHEASDGSVISQDCTQCHQVLAWDEESPEILTQLGL
jgi:hypothetical protein